MLRTVNFNPRPPCGGRLLNLFFRLCKISISIHVPRVEDDQTLDLYFTAEAISIHVPRVEDDLQVILQTQYQKIFQSTSPVWRTTAKPVRRTERILISIHVPRVEDDMLSYNQVNNICNFNPRPPCGGRQNGKQYVLIATTISIHVPRVEDDVHVFL